MPTVNIDGVGAVNFPDGMSHDQIVSAIETDILPNKVRLGVQARQQNPGPTANGDPNATEGNNGFSIHDIGAAIGHGLAHFIGAPTSAMDVISKVSPAVGLGRMAYNAGSDLINGNPSPVQGSATENALGHVPLVGRALQAVAAPAAAYANGQAPSRDQNIGAVESGTQLGATAALMHPTMGASALEGSIGNAGAALNRSATGTYADALAAKGSELRPLGESIGDQLLAKNKIMSDPRSQLRAAFDPNRGPQYSATDIGKVVDPAAEASQRAQLLKNNPGADIIDNGNKFTVSKRTPPKENVSNLQQSADDLAKQAPAAFQTPTSLPEAIATMKRLVQSPLWKTTSAVIKKQVGQAMMDGDFQKVAAIGAQVLGGANLDDEFGHDAALHGLINSVTNGQHVPPDQLQQLLQGHEAVYVDPSGHAVQVPHHVLQQTFQQLTTGDPSAMADKNAFLGQMNNFDTTKADTAEVQRRFNQ